MTGIDLLRYYATQWDRYAAGASYLDRQFIYIYRYWVKPLRNEGKKTVFPVYTVCTHPLALLTVTLGIWR